MIIAEAQMESDKYGMDMVDIISSMQEEDTSTEHHLRITHDRPIAQAIMQAGVKSLPRRFECNGERYMLIRYVPAPCEDDYNPFREIKLMPIRVEPGTVLHLYKSQCRCPSCFPKWGYDSIENYHALIPLRSDPRKHADVDIQYCTRCRKFFIEIESYNSYIREYGALNVVTKRCRSCSEKTEDLVYSKDTILSRNGYSAQLPTEERHRILVYMMERKGYRKSEIKDVLMRFLRWRANSCHNAAVAWRNDLKFVDEYKLSSQRKVIWG